jgi:hypothetical protein
MSIPFKATQHFYIFEKRPHNKIKGKVTSHPFACIAVGHEPSEPKLPFRVSATMCHPKDNFSRKVASQRALGLLHSTSEGKHAHAAWFKPSELKNVRDVLFNLGFVAGLGARFGSGKSTKPEWTRATKTLKNVLCDVQGVRFTASQKKAASKPKKA